MSYLPYNTDILRITCGQGAMPLLDEMRLTSHPVLLCDTFGGNCRRCLVSSSSFICVHMAACMGKFIKPAPGQSLGLADFLVHEVRERIKSTERTSISSSDQRRLTI